MLGKSDPLFGQPIDVWRLDFLLSIAAKLAIAEVVSKDENNIWLGLYCLLSMLFRVGKFCGEGDRNNCKDDRNRGVE